MPIGAETFSSGNLGPQQIVSGGVSQLFDYGIGMTALGLFLLASLILNYFLIRFFLTYVKDSIKVNSDMYALIDSMRNMMKAN